jgi:NADH-quinone oxidoreductase subunit K
VVALWQYLVLSAILFSIGVLGVIIKRNPIVVFMCIELMLNSVNLTFVALARFHPAPLATTLAQRQEVYLSGQMFVVFVMAVAAAEVAVGLGIIMTIFRVRKKIDVDDMSVLRG